MTFLAVFFILVLAGWEVKKHIINFTCPFKITFSDRVVINLSEVGAEKSYG